MTEKARVHAIISGRVQGVFFRMETKRMADKLGVFGWVRNQPDGTVEAVFEADRKNVDAALSWCRKGPALSSVEQVDLNWEAYTGEFEGFKIVY